LLFWLIAANCGAAYAAQISSGLSPQATEEKSFDKTQSNSETAQKLSEKHSTVEDRQRLVTIAHKLEAAPLDPALSPEREWALSWVIAAPDIHVRICTNLLADLRRPKYKYRAELTDQLLISSAAFVIEHPDQADDYHAQSIGGMEGVLKAYSSITNTQPQATAKSLDALLAKQREGKLADAVGEMVKSCQ
jgi:hypothetical protein